MRRLLLLCAAALATACGGGDHAGNVISQPTAVMTVDVQASVFTPRCAVSGCHIGQGAPMDLDLGSVASTRANTVDVPAQEAPALMRVAPGDPANSYLFRKVTHDPTILGDPMPAQGGPLTASQIELIETWIEQGAR